MFTLIFYETGITGHPVLFKIPQTHGAFLFTRAPILSWQSRELLIARFGDLVYITCTLQQ